MYKCHYTQLLPVFYHVSFAFYDAVKQLTGEGEKNNLIWSILGKGFSNVSKKLFPLSDLNSCFCNLPSDMIKDTSVIFCVYCPSRTVISGWLCPAPNAALLPLCTFEHPGRWGMKNRYLTCVTDVLPEREWLHLNRENKILKELL